MIVTYSRDFKKMFQKKDSWVQKKFGEKLSIFIQNRYDFSLHNHSLNGVWAKCRSINITGDIRAVYEEVEEDCFEFVAIGTHSELYK